jgi:predicted component of type VI protein secretion system
MYWYNPPRGTSERVEAPSENTQAIEMLAEALRTQRSW